MKLAYIGGSLGEGNTEGRFMVKINRKGRMIYNEYVQILITPHNKYGMRKYVSDCEVGNIISVHYTQLSKSFRGNITLKCDYCGKIFERQFQVYMRKYNGIIEGQKDACEDCKQLKMKDTCNSKYGVEHYWKTEESRKFKSENNYMKDPIKKEIYKNKMIEKFGVENQFQRDDIKEKSKETIKNKYGVNHIMHLNDIKNKIHTKRKQTMYENKTAPCSYQQKYIYDLIGGELNYPVDRLSLDIAFPKEMIYIEYNGGGHDFEVKIGKLTEEEFKIKENKRYFFLKSLGWKQICIQSPNDYLPPDETIILEINKSKELLKYSDKYHCIIYFNHISP
jgi:hypothetical protein